MSEIRKAIPAEAGAWIRDSDDGRGGARLVLLARDRGWDGITPDGHPELIDIFALAAREIAGELDEINEGNELDDLIRYAIYAEEWLDDNVVPAGWIAGWHDGAFFFQPCEWWEDCGGPDRMYL